MILLSDCALHHVFVLGQLRCHHSMLLNLLSGSKNY